MYKSWGAYPDKGIKIVMALMKDTIEEANAEKIRKLFKDFLFFF